MAKHIFDAFAGRGIYLDARAGADDAVEVDMDAIRERLNRIVAENDKAVRQRLVDDILAMIEGNPATEAVPVEASFNVGTVPANSFVDHCKAAARESR